LSECSTHTKKCSTHVNTFTSNKLDPSLSPFSNTGWVESQKH